MMIIPESVRNDDGSTKTKYSAIGLEHFIGAQGDTPEQASRAFEFVLVSTVAACRALSVAPFEGIARAPKEYFDAFERGHHEKTFTVPDADCTIQRRCAAA